MTYFVVNQLLVMVALSLKTGRSVLSPAARRPGVRGAQQRRAARPVAAHRPRRRERDGLPAAAAPAAGRRLPGRVGRPAARAAGADGRAHRPAQPHPARHAHGRVALGVRRRRHGAAAVRPRPLQGGQRHPRPPRGRPLPAGRRRAGSRVPCGRGTPWSGWAVTSSRCCCRRPGAREAEETARRLLEAVRAPVVLDGVHVDVDASRRHRGRTGARRRPRRAAAARRRRDVPRQGDRQRRRALRRQPRPQLHLPAGDAQRAAPGAERRRARGALPAQGGAGVGAGDGRRGPGALAPPGARAGAAGRVRPARREQRPHRGAHRPRARPRRRAGRRVARPGPGPQGRRQRQRAGPVRHRPGRPRRRGAGAARAARELPAAGGHRGLAVRRLAPRRGHPAAASTSSASPCPSTTSAPAGPAWGTCAGCPCRS